MYWDKDAETMSRRRLNALQLQRINATVRACAASPYYRRQTEEGKLFQISTLAELRRLPFTRKADLRRAFPYGLLAVDRDQVVRLHSSSGTTGNPTVVFHTRADIERWGDLIARCMYATGARSSDVFQNMMGYGLFTGGLGFHYGAERLGAMTIPIGPGNSKRQIWFLKNLQVTLVHILPSYALHLHTYFPELGIDPRKDLSLRIAFIGAEPHSEQIRRKIEELYGVRAFDSYGLSEMCGPGVAFECTEQAGLHLWEDHYYPEIVDPASGEPLPEGQFGELVLTTLQREAMPLVRYRTGDLTRLLPGDCPCGRSHVRIDRITGRSDDMLIINGVNLFPIQIEKTLMGIAEVGHNYLIEIRKESFMDRLEVKVEITEEAFRGTLAELERLRGRVAAELRAEIGLTPTVTLVEPSSLPVSEGKAKRVYDLRQQ